ncbi:MAG: uroporphyrinogen decarboxylase [Chloroflexi bacterium]|nr:uroporphyrinogen decarboxylase [Chloroflexota bacterium]MBU1750258.1 uroporphyrinogen decarboxylase [Chloroflexota bacterium]MBU1880280.1 uroporphyrinogen decarboxylase [Chloroflexota bacterium]
MVGAMTHRERLLATLQGAETDRTPISLWRHWPHADQSVDGLIRAHLDFQQTYDCDLVKFSPAGSYAVEDWGVETEFQGSPEGTRDYLSRVVHRPADWEGLQPLSLQVGRGMNGIVLEGLRGLTEVLHDQVPVIATVFSPLSLAKKLAGPRYLEDLRQSPAALHAGLRVITETSVRLARACLDAGADGLFFATQCATRELLTADEYAEFGETYDRMILHAVRGALVVVHVHGQDILFDRVAAWPDIQVINWHDRRTAPTLAEALTRFGGAVLGGLDEWDTLMEGTPAQIEAQVHDAITQTGGRRLIIGPGCVVPPAVPAENLQVARRAVETYG